jgi:hypothetical protein
VVYFSVKTYNIWDGDMTIRSGIQIENICSLGFWDMREGVILRRLISWIVECIRDGRRSYLKDNVFGVFHVKFNIKCPRRPSPRVT